MNHIDIYSQWCNSDILSRQHKEELIKIKSDAKAVQDAFYQNLEFGTGGLRGLIGVGTNRVNIYTIRKATQGLANYLTKIKSNNTVAIAYDSRYYSDVFALETALVLAANGIKVYLFEELRPTPELSYTVRHLSCDAGVVITASHNPSEYNGYKVYGADGGQITLEMATGILFEIDNTHVFRDVKRIEEKEALSKNLLQYIGKEIDKKYLTKVSNLTINKCLNKEDKKIKIVYTPLHGTGLMPVTETLKLNGYDNIILVEEQTKPDGAFPTVKSPNPEEQEALQMAIELAKKVSADIILATDPDADRVGVAIKSQNGYTLLTGNQIGSLLTYYMVNTRSEKNTNDAIVKTIVTSELGANIARKNNVTVIDTLTGFKFIGEQIKEFEKKKNYNFLLGYEESYGYLAGTFVRDKDAVISSALIVEMVAYYNKHGITITQLLEQIYKEFGYYKEELQSFTFKGLEGKVKINDTVSLFKNKELLIKTFNNIEVIEDYEKGKRYMVDDQNEFDLTLPKSNVIKIKFSDQSWFAIRSSGTEPKLKIYYSAVGIDQIQAEKKLIEIKYKIGQLING